MWFMSTIIGDNYISASLGTLTFMTPLFFTTLSTSKTKRQAFLPVLKIPMTYRKQNLEAVGGGLGVGSWLFCFPSIAHYMTVSQIFSCQLLESYLCFEYIYYLKSCIVTLPDFLLRSLQSMKYWIMNSPKCDCEMRWGRSLCLFTSFSQIRWKQYEIRP